MSKQRKIKVIHNAPGKKGKLEYREFKTQAECEAYFERNADRIAGVTAAEKIARKMRGSA